MRFEPTAPRSSLWLRGRKGLECQAAESAHVGMEVQEGEQSKPLGPRGGAEVVGVERHALQLGFFVLPAPGVSGELPVTTGVGARAGCSPMGQCPIKRVLVLELRAWS